MTYTQTVEIPADRRIVVEAPREIPTGTKARFEVIWHTPDEDAPEKSAAEIAREMWDSLPTLEDCLEDARKKTEERLRTGIDPLLKWRDSLNGKKLFGGVDGVAYQRSIRDEWPD